MRFFLMSQGSLDPKIRFLDQKVCSVARKQTHTYTHTHEREYRGHPVRVSGIFPSFLQPTIKDRSNNTSILVPHLRSERGHGPRNNYYLLLQMITSRFELTFGFCLSYVFIPMRFLTSITDTQCQFNMMGLWTVFTFLFLFCPVTCIC